MIKITICSGCSFISTELGCVSKLRFVCFLLALKMSPVTEIRYWFWKTERNIQTSEQIDHALINTIKLTLERQSSWSNKECIYVFCSRKDIHNFPKSQMVFSQACAAWLMLFFWIQEGGSVGSGILQLLVTDRDTPQNGPPFSFHIVSGNEDRSFQIDQGGLLSISSPLRRRSKPQHLLKIQVKDFIH